MDRKSGLKGKYSKGSGLHNWVDGDAIHWEKELEKIMFEEEIHEFDVDMVSLRGAFQTFK